MAANPRDAESRTYAANLEDWLAEHEGQWVVLEGDVVIGFFPSAEAGYMSAATLLNTRDFFMRQVHARYRKAMRSALVLRGPL